MTTESVVFTGVIFTLWAINSLAFYIWGKASVYREHYASLDVSRTAGCGSTKDTSSVSITTTGAR